MLNRIEELCDLSGVSSREDAVRGYLRRCVERYADGVCTDAFGNLIVFKKGAKPTGNALLLDAPMDEVGVMVSDFTDDGCLRFQCVGSVDRRNLIGKRIYLGEERILGVFGMKPIHLSTRAERKVLPREEELYIDIGCAKKKKAENLTPLGEIGVFDGECGTFGDGLFYGKAAGNRAACAVLLRLLEEELPCDVTVVFSAQREVGARGAFGSAFSVKPKVALTLDGCAAYDFPAASGADVHAKLGRGAVLPLYDRRTAFDRKMFEKLRELAEINRINWQIQESKAPDSTAAVYHTRGAGCTAAGISLPVRYRHAPSEVISLRDVEAVLSLCRAFVGFAAETLEEERC